MSSDDESTRGDARGETARLARALARHVRRRAAAGERRTRMPSEKRNASRADAQPAKAAIKPRESTAATSRVNATNTPGATVKTSRATPIARSAEDVRRLARGARDLGELRALVAGCEACGLCRTRTQTVFMDGNGSRRVLFVGEAPGADEDRRGVPFVGRAGQLLTDIITKGMGIARDEVFIANVLKCRPPDNRDPTTEEKATCTPWLDRQIELMDPEVIIPLGRHAAMHVLGGVASMGAMRGKVHERGGRKVVPTFHPAYLLRSPGEKKECWKDIQLAMGVLGLERKSRGADGPEASG